MPNSFDGSWESVVVLAATFLMHSTFWLIAAWGVSRWRRFDRPELSERLWRLAAVLGLFTAPAQLASQWSQPVWQWRIVSPSTLIVASNKTPVPSETTEEPERNNFRSRSRETSVRTLTSSATSATSATSRSHHGPVSELRSPTKATIVEPLVPAPDDSANESEAWRSAVVIAPGETGHSADARRFAKAAAGDESVGQVSIWPVNQNSVAGWNPAAQTATAARIIAVVLTCLVLSGAVRLAWQTWRFSRQLRNAMLVNAGATRQSLDRLLQRARVRHPVSLLASERIPEPVAFGLWRWTIVVPSGLEDRLSPEELRAVLAHEVAHLVRGDVLWLWIGRVLTSCLAFQPLHRIAVRRWQHAAECLCDDWAVKHSVSAVTLAKCLTRVAGWRLERRMLAGGLAAVGSPSLLTARVERLLSGQAGTESSRSRRVRRLVSVVALAMSVAVATWAPCAARPTQTDRRAEGASLPVAVDATEFGAVGELTPSAGPTSDSRAAPWQALSIELRGLSDDFSHVDALLKQSEPDAEALEASSGFRGRVVEVRARFQKLKASVSTDQGQ